MQLALFDEPQSTPPARSRHRDVVGVVAYKRAQPVTIAAQARQLVSRPDELEQAAQRFEREAHAEATRRNYQRD